MMEVLQGQVIYTDAADFDGFWVRRLFKAEGLELNFEFSDMETLLRKLLPMEYWIRNRETCELPIYAVMKEARKQCGCDAHRAANDVTYLIRLYKNARKLAGYY
jgi:hypothetical protein